MRERERAVQQSGERGAWADAKKSNQKTAMERGRTHEDARTRTHARGRTHADAHTRTHARGRTHADARTRDVPLVVIRRAFFYFSKIKKKL